MSNRFWYKNDHTAMCEITKEECPYPYSYCSVCPVDNPSGSREKAQLWDEERKPEEESKRKAALEKIWNKKELKR